MPFSLILPVFRDSHDFLNHVNLQSVNLQTCKSINLQTVHIFMDCL